MNDSPLRVYDDYKTARKRIYDRRRRGNERALRPSKDESMIFPPASRFSLRLAPWFFPGCVLPFHARERLEMRSEMFICFALSRGGVGDEAASSAAVSSITRGKKTYARRMTRHHRRRICRPLCLRSYAIFVHDYFTYFNRRRGDGGSQGTRGDEDDDRRRR